MAFWNKIFGKKEDEQKVGGMEDFMTLPYNKFAIG